MPPAKPHLIQAHHVTIDPGFSSPLPHHASVLAS